MASPTPDSPAKRFHFNLRSFLFLLAMFSVGFAFVPWFSGDIDAWIYLFLLAVGPLSIWIEIHAQPHPWDFSIGWLDRAAERLVEWMLFSIGPLLVGVGWWLASDVFDGPLQQVEPPLLMSLAGSLRMRTLDAILVPPLTFLALYADLMFVRWPRPVPLRVPTLPFIFTALSVLFFAIDAYLGFNKPRSVVVAATWFNGVAMLALWLYWRRIRKNASRASFMLLAMLMHCWLFGIAFQPVGGVEARIRYQAFNLDRLFGPGRAPEVDLIGWQSMELGLSRHEVAQLLGGSRHSSLWRLIQQSNEEWAKAHEVWQYNWQGGGFPIVKIHESAYVVWFDNSGHVLAFRPPIGSDENRGGQLRSMEETLPLDENLP